VFAYPHDADGGWPSFRSDYLASLEEHGVEPELIEELSGSFTGLRSVFIWEDGGQTWAEISHWVWDEETPAVHQFLTVADPDTIDETLVEMRELLESAVWIPAIEPSR
jgi:hypothetical protein